MAIRITEDDVVNYENSPDVNRKLFPNLNICGKEIDKLADEIDGKAPAVFSTASGSIASFTDGADDMPMKSCVVSFEPIQEGEGDPSPENVRPITGRTGLTVYHSGSDTSNPTEFAVSWESEAGAVYAGTLDVISGKLTVTHEGIVLNGSEDWERVTGNYPYFRLKISPYDIAVPNVSICDRLPRVTITSTSNNQGFNVYYSSASGGGCYIGLRYNDAFSSDDVDSVKTWLSQNNTTVVYQLLEPKEIQLAPQEIRTLLGENNIWSDGGDVTVEYPTDTKTYIDAKVSPVQDVQVNGTSILDAQGVANVPVASSSALGVIKPPNQVGGISISNNGEINTKPATEEDIKVGTSGYKPIVPYRQNLATFYGLAKAAGDTTQSASSNAVGSYTEEAKAAIQVMLGIADIIGPVEGATASVAYSSGDAFLHASKLYKATVAIASGDAIVPGTNCEQTTIIDILKGA